jgi:hypothetical protein
MLLLCWLAHAHPQCSLTHAQTSALDVAGNDTKKEKKKFPPKKK